MAYPTTTHSADHDTRSAFGRRGRGPVIAAGVAVLVVVVIGFLLTASSASDPMEASVGEIVAQPDAFDGDRVVARATVDELLTDRTLVVQPRDGSDAGLLVLLRPGAAVNGSLTMQAGTVPMPELLGSNDTVELSGTVEAVDPTRMATSLRLVLNDRLFGDWEGRPSVIVDRIDLVDVEDTAA